MKYKKTLLLVLLFLVMYGAGVGAAKIVDVFSGSQVVSQETENWGLGFGAEGSTPTGQRKSFILHLTVDMKMEIQNQS